MAQGEAGASRVSHSCAPLATTLGRARLRRTALLRAARLVGDKHRVDGLAEEEKHVLTPGRALREQLVCSLAQQLDCRAPKKDLTIAHVAVPQPCGSVNRQHGHKESLQPGQKVVQRLDAQRLEERVQHGQLLLEN